jgi:AraC-like DNA-binding protein
MALGKHHILQELIIPPSTEQIPPFEGWLVARVAEGVGYWLQHDLPAYQLNIGDVFVATDIREGQLRASQLDPLKLQFFTVQPRQLEGLLSVVEWHRIELAGRQPRVPVRIFGSRDSIGQKFTRLANLSHTEKLPLRCALLQLWAAATADLTTPMEVPLEEGNKVRARFWWLLSRLTQMELGLSSPIELARQVNCSERHFRALFRQEFGVSMHDYQAAQKLNFDRQLPREPAEKTSDNECRKQKRIHVMGQKAPAGKLSRPRARRVRSETPFAKNRNRTNVEV